MLAHVTYVTQDEPSPDPIGFLLGVVSRPENALLLFLGGAAVIVGLLGWARWRPLAAPWARFTEQAWTYRPLVPWMLRISVGLVLIGAGLSRSVFAPDVQIASWPYPLLTALGFLLLLGFGVRLAALLGLAAYGVSLLAEPRLLEILDVAGGLAAIALLGPGIPSLDDLLRAAFPGGLGARAATAGPGPERFRDLLPFVVRLGLGGAFLASGVLDKLLVYERGLQTVRQYSLTSIVPVDPGLWVVGAGLIESALGLAILLGLATRASAIVGFAVLTLTLFGLPDDPVVAHVGLFGLSSVLVVLGAGRWSLDRMLLPQAAPSAEASR